LTIFIWNSPERSEGYLEALDILHRGRENRREKSALGKQKHLSGKFIPQEVCKMFMGHRPKVLRRCRWDNTIEYGFG